MLLPSFSIRWTIDSIWWALRRQESPSVTGVRFNSEKGAAIDLMELVSYFIAKLHLCSLSNTQSRIFYSYFQALPSNVDNPQFCTCVRIRVSNRNTTSNSLAKVLRTFWRSPDEGIAGDEDNSHRATLNERHSQDAVDCHEERHRTRRRHKSQFRLFSSS